jgi:hypothetical protein
MSVGEGQWRETRLLPNLDTFQLARPAHNSWTLPLFDQADFHSILATH